MAGLSSATNVVILGEENNYGEIPGNLDLNFGNIQEYNIQQKNNIDKVKDMNGKPTFNGYYMGLNLVSGSISTVMTINSIHNILSAYSGEMSIGTETQVISENSFNINDKTVFDAAGDRTSNGLKLNINDETLSIYADFNNFSVQDLINYINIISKDNFAYINENDKLTVSKKILGIDTATLNPSYDDNEIVFGGGPSLVDGTDDKDKFRVNFNKNVKSYSSKTKYDENTFLETTGIVFKDISIDLKVDTIITAKLNFIAKYTEKKSGSITKNITNDRVLHGTDIFFKLGNNKIPVISFSISSNWGINETESRDMEQMETGKGRTINVPIKHLFDVSGNIETEVISQFPIGYLEELDIRNMEVYIVNEKTFKIYLTNFLIIEQSYDVKKENEKRKIKGSFQSLDLLITGDI